MNQQIKNEMESAYIYMSIAAYFRSFGLDGMAQWMRVQTQEELVHAMKFFDHIKDCGDPRGGLDVANTSVFVEGKSYGRAFV